MQDCNAIKAIKAVANQQDNFRLFKVIMVFYSYETLQNYK